MTIGNWQVDENATHQSEVGCKKLLHCCYILFSVLFQTKSSLVWKVTPKNCVQFSKPIPVWFGKKKIDFARRRFQTKFRLVWKILMTIVNVLKIPNQYQFGLEKSLTIANALNLEPIPVLLCKISFQKVKTLKHTNTRLTDKYVRILAKSDVLEEQRLRANFEVNICDKDGLTNL